MPGTEAVRRGAIAQTISGCDCVAITSGLDGTERVYMIGMSDAYDTMLRPVAADAAATSVGTRALIEAVAAGRARPCSLVPTRSGRTDDGHAAVCRDRSRGQPRSDESSFPIEIGVAVAMVDYELA